MASDTAKKQDAKQDAKEASIQESKDLAKMVIEGLKKPMDDLKKMDPLVQNAVGRALDIEQGQRTARGPVTAVANPVQKVFGHGVRFWERTSGLIWSAVGGVGIYTIGKFIPVGMRVVGRIFSGSGSDSDTTMDAPSLEVVGE